MLVWKCLLVTRVMQLERYRRSTYVTLRTRTHNRSILRRPKGANRPPGPARPRPNLLDRSQNSMSSSSSSIGSALAAAVHSIIAGWNVGRVRPKAVTRHPPAAKCRVTRFALTRPTVGAQLQSTRELTDSQQPSAPRRGGDLCAETVSPHASTTDPSIPLLAEKAP